MASGEQVERSCCRCGSVFIGTHGSRVCPKCSVARVPRLPVSGESFTHREREILDLIYRGFDNARIARTLRLCKGTVKVYLHMMFVKAGVESREELMARRIRELEDQILAERGKVA